ncbi:hypothetical protein [Sphingobium fuliginis]|uniref:Spore coat protein U domain-containing protein n=1 Tax=Sphingobium fuliginis (strain ATCC 27551) TaxID=336203 RepID=A0A292Z6E1_SPHSA|nr:hypothetical protein [Sphingobium fuliginis]GAY20992.1 hypothetical protein SFOMI_1522 [Sphingobium fuliginis]
MSKALFSALLLASAFTTPVWAKPDESCKLRIDATQGQWIISGYDAFSDSPAIGSFDLTFVNSGEGACRFLPIFQTDGSPFGLTSGNGPTLPYSLFDLYGGYDATPIGGRTLRTVNHRRVEIAPHAQQIVRYTLNVGGTIPGDGLFKQRLAIIAEDDNGSALAERSVNVGIHVLPSATLGLAGAFQRHNGQADIDLGELQTGIAAVPLALSVQSTRGYTLAFKSLNAGNLRLSGAEWKIPYRLIVDGQLLDLGAESLYTKRASSMRRDSLPVAFQIGDVSGKRAGTYSDLVTVTVSVD